MNNLQIEIDKDELLTVEIEGEKYYVAAVRDTEISLEQSWGKFDEHKEIINENDINPDFLKLYSDIYMKVRFIEQPPYPYKPVVYAHKGLIERTSDEEELKVIQKHFQRVSNLRAKDSHKSHIDAIVNNVLTKMIEEKGE